MKNQVIKFSTTFALIYSIPIFLIFFMTHKFPPIEKMVQIFGFYLIPSLLALGLTAIFTKKGKTVSPIKFGFFLLIFLVIFFSMHLK